VIDPRGMRTTSVRPAQGSATTLMSLLLGGCSTAGDDTMRTAMLRSRAPQRALPATAALAVAAVLTFGAAATLDPHAPADAPADAPAAPHATLREPAPTPTHDAAEELLADEQGPPVPAAPVPPSSAPVSLVIGVLGVDAPLVSVGVLPGGVMEIPHAVDTVGWYATDDRRVSPGDPGMAVLAGHRDSRLQGPGALHDLGRLAPGDAIRVTHIDGRTSAWQVDEVMETLRDALPTEVLFARGGAPRLALVTCGGTFDRRTRSYSHNTIVFASLSSSPSD